MGIYKEYDIECQDAGINHKGKSPFTNKCLEDSVVENSNPNSSRTRSKTGISVKSMSYDEAERIVRGFQRTDPYLVELASKYVPSNQVPAVMNYNNLSHEEFRQFLHIGKVVLGVAKKISSSRK